jgi:hypothetical protein
VNYKRGANGVDTIQADSFCRHSDASGVDTSDVIASGCSRNTIAVKIYYPARRLNEAKTNKLLKNERSRKG